MINFKVFNNMTYGHVAARYRTKLEDMSKKYVFIGYDKKVKVYIVSRDTQNDEENKWSWNNKKEKSSKNSKLGRESSENERQGLENGGRSSKSIAWRKNEKYNEEDELVQPRIQSLQNIYNSIDEIHVVCFLVGAKDVSSKEVVQDD